MVAGLNLFAYTSSAHQAARSMIEVDTRNPDEPILRVEVVIDGKLAYR